MPGYSDPGFDTLALHAGAAPDPTTGARAVPIHLSTSFVFESSEHAAALFNLERAALQAQNITDFHAGLLALNIAHNNALHRRSRSMRPPGRPAVSPGDPP